MTSNELKKPDWAYYTEPRFVDVDGIATAYRREGSGERVLYLHGDGFTRMWLPFYAELAKTVDLIASEHPGYGDTQITDEIQSFDDLVLHYDSLLDALKLEPVHVVGHGLGGWLAAGLAIYYPRRFKSLTLITPTGVRLPDTDSIDIFRMTDEERVEALFNGRGSDYSEYIEQEGQPDDMIRRMVESATTGRLMWNPRYDYRLDRRLRRLDVPTLVVGAEDDRMVPTEMAARFADLIPGAKLHTVEGGQDAPSGHLPHIEDAPGTASLVASHIVANS